MRAAYYEQNGPAREVLKLGEIDTPRPDRARSASKSRHQASIPPTSSARSGATRKIAYPRVIPHSDGAGEIDMVGDGVSCRPARRAGLDVECAMAACLRHLRGIRHAAIAAGGPPAGQYEFRGWSLFGIPAMTAYHAVAVSGAAPGATILHRRWSRFRWSLRGAIRQDSRRHRHYHHQLAGEGAAARDAGADHTIDYKREHVGERVMAMTGKKGVDAIIELDVTANAQLIPQVLRPRGLVVVYGTGSPESEIPLMFCLRHAITLKFVYVYELDASERAAALAAIVHAGGGYADHKCRHYVAACGDCRRP